MLLYEPWKHASSRLFETHLDQHPTTGTMRTKLLANIATLTHGQSQPTSAGINFTLLGFEEALNNDYQV